MKRIYTVVIHLAFGGISNIKTFEDKQQMEASVLEWVNSNSPDGVNFADPYEGVEWFKENSDKVEEGIVIHDEVLASSPLSVPLGERIREHCKEMAVRFYTGDGSTVGYGDAMEADDIFNITSVWEPFERRESNEVKDLIADEADRLEALGEKIVSMMSIEELLEQIARRAQAEGIIETRGNICLMTIKGMSDAEKDDCEENGWGLKSDQVIVDTDEYKGDSPYIQKAKAFGISYIHGT